RVHHHAVAHLRQILDYAIELAGAHAHATAIERRVRAPADDRAAALGDLDPVAVSPDAGIVIEVAVAIAAPVGIIPKIHRHAGHGLTDHELPHLPHDGLA